MQSFDFINQSNAQYVDQLYEQYKQDPRSIPEAWRQFFAGFEMGLQRSDQPDAPKVEATQPLVMGVYDLVHSYRELGHFQANLDPLGITVRPPSPLLDLANFGLRPVDLDRQVGSGGFAGPTDGSLRDLVSKLQETYCRTLGVEYIGIADKNQREWLQQRMEPVLNHPNFSADERRWILRELIFAEEFEQYLGRAFKEDKRFGADGAEAMVALVNTIVNTGAELGVEQMIFGMPHRGRLNLLAHVFNKPYEAIISEFMKTALPMVSGGDGDVKYHYGFANERVTASGKRCKVSLLPNPSHLELVNPIHQGIVRCKQVVFGDRDRERVIPICLHGDAAFVGQGVVTETLNLSELPGWRTGGTIHIIVNNQIGFTTPPAQGRFTPYATDGAKAIQAPVFHINGDDPEAVVWAAKLAMEFRQTFKCDVLLDLWCYRRFGHNEQDAPDFTQPVMYRIINEHPSVRAQYQKRLIEQGVVSQEECDAMKAEIVERMSTAREAAKETRPRTKVPTFGGVWKGYGPAPSDWSAKTSLPRERLQQVIDVYKRLPEDFTPHPKLKRLIIDKRIEMVETGEGIDWGCAELLACGSLLVDGYSIRITGQDVERGTFSHRHAVFTDYNTGKKLWPLAHMWPNQGMYSYVVMNSMLSEFAVLGFEWGYASADPRNLVIWEAQFGDFVNGAQPIIDQIICSAESKWRYMNGMVLALPHGYEGAGPEHSHAYLERFLQLSGDDNWQVCVLSTPAQYFHALRRQMLRKFRKPLVLMQPKASLRDPLRASSISEFTDVDFRTIIDDPSIREPDRVRRVLICSGKMYYTLRDARDASADLRDQIAIIRMEQIYPFPEKELEVAVSRYRRMQDMCWVQEEPKNRGAWFFVEPRLRAMFPDMILSYIGRDASASPATGSVDEHKKEEREIVGEALKLTSRVRGDVPVTK